MLKGKEKKGEPYDPALHKVKRPSGADTHREPWLMLSVIGLPVMLMNQCPLCIELSEL